MTPFYYQSVFVPRNLGICAICVVHSQNPQIAFQSRDCATIVRNLQIVQITHAVDTEDS